MKSVFLSIVVICALAIAGIGGVFANYQDIETSEDNYVETGDLDLKVSYKGVDYDDPNVPMLISADNFMPECMDKSFHFDLHNAGDYDQGTGWVYFHFKNLKFKDTGRSEPEIAAEMGRTPIGESYDGTFIYADPPLGYGWGTLNGALADHISVNILTGPDPFPGGTFTQLDLSAYDANGDGVIKLSELVCEQVLIGELDSGETIYVWVSLWLQDVPEGTLGYNLFHSNSHPEEAKWEDWPTNALMNDQVTFDISFELFQFEL